MKLLFGSRLLLFLTAVSLPLFHPAIVVPYDRPSLVLWFFLVPWEMAMGFAGPAFPKKPLYRLLAVLLPLTLLPLLFAGWSWQALGMAAVGAFAYFLTALLFRYPPLGRRIAFIEPFLLAGVYLKLINFFRASEEFLAGNPGGGRGSGAFLHPQLLMGIFLAAFLFHGWVLYRTLYRERGRKGRREGLLLLGGCVLATGALFLLPPDSVKNAVITNLRQHEVNPPPEPVNEEGDGFPNGSLRSRRDGVDRGLRLPGRREGSGRRNRLETIPQDQWPGTGDRSGQGEGGKQYAVMVVASKRDPLYMANEYRGRLHPAAGFIPLEGELLNELGRMRLLETWKNRDPDFDLFREEVSYFALSTEGTRYLPYRPYTVEPTIFQRQYRPFLFQYRGTSRISRSTPLEWKNARELTEAERTALEPYLEVTLARSDRELFQKYLSTLLKGGEGFFQRILSILQGFSSFQYELGFSEDTSIEALVKFLSISREGDCTEFSNTAALLARMAGIPSRVVTGFLASEELQTPAHVRGLALLRQALPPLQSFPLEELFLVTTAHRHSWAQFWIPELGWVDFETTSFALPPLGMGDPNNRDVVIPLIEEEAPLVPVPAFPWKLVLRAIAILASVGIGITYAYRYGREGWYRYLSRRKGTRAARALYRLLLLHLAAEGYPLKRRSLTPREYAETLRTQSEEMERFFTLYTELSYRSRMGADEVEEKVRELRALYESLRQKTRRSGALSWLSRLLSLRGLAYVW